jgi:carbamoyl-phosphate synthase large subunit/carbamoyl-phosphate synthase small subunit
LVGNYGVPSDERDAFGLLKHFESEKIHIAGLVVQDYSHNYSHYSAVKSLSEWLIEHDIPALYSVDTRLITKKLCESQSMLGKIVFNSGDAQNMTFYDPNETNLVEKVSCKQVQVYGSGNPRKVIAIDCGIKHNIIRMLVQRDMEVKVVPYNYNFLNEEYDGLFISNGPGDPTMCSDTIQYLRQAIQQNKPIFGICLGNQLLGLAAGASTFKLPYGNRGHNQPCISQLTDLCYITSQNHGFAIDNESLPDNWKPLFINANDETNEGIYCLDKPFFSTQFHPEATGGPEDTYFMFDHFRDCIDAYHRGEVLLHKVNKPASQRVNAKKVLILGSGGLTIGQAGEFDYSGSQAIKALKEEGISTVLINPNIATTQTSKGLADKVYFLPVDVESVEEVIQKEQPDSIYLTFGGQTALNCGIELWRSGILEKYNVRVLGTQVQTIIDTEDRDIFKQRMLSIHEKLAQSYAATTMEEAVHYANKIGYPVIVRSAFALGGLGSGFANNDEEFRELAETAFSASSQILIDESLKGWKEVEYEVVRDAYDNCITVTNMENFDPCGIHTGESIVIAPSQTLTNEEYHMLRTTAIKVIRHLGIVGECNIQYALHPYSKEYRIIEVNARLSRSSALASKATGYPLAYIAAKLGLGIPLPTIKNTVTKKTTACFEPSLDYCVIKMPRWDLKKFVRVSTKIGSAMKSVGEVMAIGRNFEETIQKAIRMVDTSYTGFDPLLDDSGKSIFKNQQELDEELRNPTDRRIFAIADAMLNWDYSIDKLNDITKIDKWFLYKLKNITDTKVRLFEHDLDTVPVKLMHEAKKNGLSDKQIGLYTRSTTPELQVRALRIKMGVTPYVKQIDTLAAEFPCYTNYLYTTYSAMENDLTFDDKGVMVLGSGVYRIGSSVEFDYCSVMCVRALKKLGYKTLMVNYNPETVSTDFDESDRLYFDELSLERTLDIYQIENAQGAIVSVGGQQPNNIALTLHKNGVKILGTTPQDIDRAENRDVFSSMLDQLKIDQPTWASLRTLQEAQEFARQVEYPVLIRPSYVLSGAAMNIANDERELNVYLKEASSVSPDHPVVISKFIDGAKEVEVDGVAYNGEIVVHAISEHIENAGTHSGDATLVLPPHTLDEYTQDTVLANSKQIAKALNISGPFNIQYLAKGKTIKVIECNLRASRSFPFCSKVLDIDFIDIAAKSMTGKYTASDAPQYNQRELTHCGVKSPMFSFRRLQDADPTLGVEMASTGEVACFGKNVNEAFLKSFRSSGIKISSQNKNILISTLPESDPLTVWHKDAFKQSLHTLQQQGFQLHATSNIYSNLILNYLLSNVEQVEVTKYISKDGSKLASLSKLSAEEQNDTLKSIGSNVFAAVVNVSFHKETQENYLIRRKAIDFNVPLFNNYEIFNMFTASI